MYMEGYMFMHQTVEPTTPSYTYTYQSLNVQQKLPVEFNSLNQQSKRDMTKVKIADRVTDS